ncbi:MAG TPA: hypothetical protein VGG34_04060 [Opitutaceae bacterium]|jgi:hypothetical protein
MSGGPDDQTGLPGLRTWRRVYWAVVAALAAWVVFLCLLDRAFG